MVTRSSVVQNQDTSFRCLVKNVLHELAYWFKINMSPVHQEGLLFKKMLAVTLMLSLNCCTLKVFIGSDMYLI